MMIDDQDIHTIFNFEVSVSKIKLIVQKIKQFQDIWEKLEVELSADSF